MQKCVVKPCTALQNKHQMHFNRPWSSAGPQPECYHGMGYLFDRTGQKQGRSTHPKFLRPIQNQQMRSTKSLLWCIYGPFLLVRSVKSSKFSWEKKPLYNCLALMERINFKNMKKKRFPFYGWLSAAQLEPEHPCGGRKPTRELSWRESYRRRETWKGKLIRKKRKNRKRKAKKKLELFFQERGLWRCSSSQDWLYICVELSRDRTDGNKMIRYLLFDTDLKVDIWQWAVSSWRRDLGHVCW